MQKYEYVTDSISLGMSKNKAQNSMQAKLEERSKEGWRLAKCEISDWIGAIILIFEREI